MPSAPSRPRRRAVGPDRYDLIAFDLGGVLFDIQVDRYLEQASRALGIAADVVAAATFQRGVWSAAEVGALDAAGFIDAVLRQLGRAGEPSAQQELAAAWCAIPELRSGVWPLLARLRVAAGAWSNTDPLHRQCILEASGLETCLATVTTSCGVGVEKPSCCFYQRALARAGVAAHRVAFVDDRGDNVAAARALGIDAFVATSLHGVETGLLARGLLRR